MAVLDRTNDAIAEMFEQIATLLRYRGSNPFRIRAYEAAATTLRQLDRDVTEILPREGIRGLVRLPGIGRGLARQIESYCRCGHLEQLDELLAQATPEALFATVPGIGPALARRIRDRLGLRTLEELEAAAHDGRLERVPGFGSRRARMVRDSLAVTLDRAARRRRLRAEPAIPHPTVAPVAPPPVGLLLAIDERYRRNAGRGRLPTIRPRRFTPEARRWLPVLRTRAAGWQFTALFSNTARAHALGRTDDWVVIRYRRDGTEGQATVVTEHHGPLSGTRVVRGRERECFRQRFHLPASA